MKRMLATIIFCALFACSFSAWAAPVTLHCFVHYSSEGEKLVFDYAMAKVKEKYPDVTIIPDVMPQDQDAKIKTLAATGDLPDLLEVNESLVDLFNKSNLLLPLDKYIKDNKITDYYLASASPYLKDAQGRITAVCNTMRNVGLIYCNKKLFADNGIKVPTQYSDFLTAVKAFKARGILPLSLFAKEGWPTFTFYDMIVSGQEPGGFKKIESGTVKMTDPAYVNAAKKLVELVNAGLLSKDAFITAYETAKATFLDGKAAMFLNGSWDCKDIGDKMGANVTLLYPGVLADKAGQWNSVGGGFGNGFAASANGPNKEIAGAIAGYLAVKMTEARIVKVNYINSMLAGDFQPEVPYNGLSKQLSSAMKNLNAGTSFFWGLVNLKIKMAIDENLAKLASRQISADDFIKQTDAEVKEALSGN